MSEQGRNSKTDLMQKQDGFALVASMLIVAVVSVAAIPLLNLVGGSEESNVKQQVTSFLNAEARENLELSVYLAKSAGGIPGFYNTSHTPQSQALARACERRVNQADPQLIGTGNSIEFLTNAAYAPITSINGRESTAFVVDKGKAEQQDNDGDDRYHRYLIASCATATGFGMALYTSEIANIQGSFYTLNLNEY
ncbi:MAG: hypothetical protein ACON49_06205 [Candidatus Puniceispirillaceae bacterium]